MHSWSKGMAAGLTLIRSYEAVGERALNYLKEEKRFKGRDRRKQKKTALNETYLVAIFAV